MTSPVLNDSASSINGAAQRLVAANETTTPCAPIRDLISADDVKAAYAVQRKVVQARTSLGHRVVGRKIGLTSAAVQQQLGVDQPDFGVLLDDMAYETGATIDRARFIQPRVEAEIAFVLGEDLDTGLLDIDRVRRSVDYAVAALEICDSRIADWDISLVDTIADNASSGAFVLGRERCRLDEFEPRKLAMTMEVTGHQSSGGIGSASLGDPIRALQWLAQRARDLAEPLRAGQVILSGALGPMMPVSSGAVVTASLSDLGTVTCSLTGAEQ